MKNINKFSFLILLAFGLSQCTDLETIETDSVVSAKASGFVPQDPAKVLSSIYSTLSDFANQDGTYSLTEHTTDEMIPPTRGTDWGDNGIWRSLHAHTWNANHAYIRTTWNVLNGKVYACNELLASNPSAQQAAEGKFLRAFCMYQVLDNWGQVPFRDVTDADDYNPKVFSRQEAFDFIVKDLTEAAANLPANGDSKKATQAAANALLARVYLNKAVYTSAKVGGPYTFDPADMNKVVGYCDAVKAAGYSLDSDFFNNFLNTAQKELIFSTDQGNISSRYFMSLHYDQKPGGWNGFTTLADFYDSFEASDIRRGKPGPKDGTEEGALPYGFLLGKQYDKAGKEIINGRTQAPLNYTKDVPLAGANTDQGIRVVKYHPVNRGNLVFLRFADVHLMKAEALMRSGKSSEGLTLVNELRTLRGASTLAALDEKAMLAERGRELYWEGIRRTDQIRFGTFNAPYQDMANTSVNTVLYPIPLSAILTNPNLKQNDGY